MFFFKKKNEKTFAPRYRRGASQRNSRSFLLLFFKKKPCLPLPAGGCLRAADPSN
jgi:hypothetical protein